MYLGDARWSEMRCRKMQRAIMRRSGSRVSGKTRLRPGKHGKTTKADLLIQASLGESSWVRSRVAIASWSWISRRPQARLYSWHGADSFSLLALSSPQYHPLSTPRLPFYATLHFSPFISALSVPLFLSLCLSFCFPVVPPLFLFLCRIYSPTLYLSLLRLFSQAGSKKGWSIRD